MDIFKSFECSKMKNICRQMQLVTKKNRNLTPHLQIIQAIDYYYNLFFISVRHLFFISLIRSLPTMCKSMCVLAVGHQGILIPAGKQKFRAPSAVNGWDAHTVLGYQTLGKRLIGSCPLITGLWKCLLEEEWWALKPEVRGRRGPREHTLPVW